LVRNRYSKRSSFFFFNIVPGGKGDALKKKTEFLKLDTTVRIFAKIGGKKCDGTQTGVQFFPKTGPGKMDIQTKRSQLVCEFSKIANSQTFGMGPSLFHKAFPVEVFSGGRPIFFFSFFPFVFWDLFLWFRRISENL